VFTLMMFQPSCNLWATGCAPSVDVMIDVNDRKRAEPHRCSLAHETIDGAPSRVGKLT
jgi:hypothetical protein